MSERRELTPGEIEATMEVMGYTNPEQAIRHHTRKDTQSMEEVEAGIKWERDKRLETYEQTILKKNG